MLVSKKILCEVCSEILPEPQLSLGDHPLPDDLIPVDMKLNCETHPIDVSLCQVCLTASQIHSVDKKLLFPSTYHYRARFTSDVVRGMDDLAENVCNALQSTKGEGYVLDIGCNDGSLLNFFHDRGWKTVGVEPTDAANDVDHKKHKVFKKYFDLDMAKILKANFGSPRIITFTNVFAHIENLQKLISALSFLINDHTWIVIENHYLGSILSGGQFDTFYHEHPRTYSAKSFDYIAKDLGKKVILRTFPKRYGGNIRVWIADKNTFVGSFPMDEAKEESFYEDFTKIPRQIDAWLHEKSKEIRQIVSQFGPIPAKAFPGRGAILVKLLALDTSSISAVYERSGSMKIGHYVPGTRIQIRDEIELFGSENQKPVLNIAWHIKEEIHSYLNLHMKNVRIIDIK